MGAGTGLGRGLLVLGRLERRWPVVEGQRVLPEGMAGARDEQLLGRHRWRSAIAGRLVDRGRRGERGERLVGVRPEHARHTWLGLPCVGVARPGPQLGSLWRVGAVGSIVFKTKPVYWFDQKNLNRRSLRFSKSHWSN
jgi:hypothetical protein